MGAGLLAALLGVQAQPNAVDPLDEEVHAAHAILNVAIQEGGDTNALDARAEDCVVVVGARSQPRPPIEDVWRQVGDVNVPQRLPKVFVLLVVAAAELANPLQERVRCLRPMVVIFAMSLHVRHREH